MSLVQLTLRRWGEIATSPRFYLYVLGFILIGALFGPYGTFDQLTLLERLNVSLQLNVICWFIGVVIAVPVRLVLMRLGSPLVPAIILSCLAATVVVIPSLVYALKIHLDVTFSQTQYIEHTILVTILVVLIALAMLGSRRLQRDAPIDGEANENSESYSFVATTPRDPDKCPLQQKLPKEKRGVLYAMVAQDHYVEMITDKGSELVLMRLSDAAGQANPKYGIRIHRSAWISVFGVAELAKRGRQSVVKLRNGRELPVSRSSESNLRAFFQTASSEETLIYSLARRG